MLEVYAAVDHCIKEDTVSSDEHETVRDTVATVAQREHDAGTFSDTVLASALRILLCNGSEASHTYLLHVKMEQLYNGMNIHRAVFPNVSGMKTNIFNKVTAKTIKDAASMLIKEGRLEKPLVKHPP